MSGYVWQGVCSVMNEFMQFAWPSLVATECLWMYDKVIM